MPIEPTPPTAAAAIARPPMASELVQLQTIAKGADTAFSTISNNLGLEGGANAPAPTAQQIADSLTTLRTLQPQLAPLRDAALATVGTGGSAATWLDPQTAGMYKVDADSLLKGAATLDQQLSSLTPTSDRKTIGAALYSADSLGLASRDLANSAEDAYNGQYTFTPRSWADSVIQGYDRDGNHTITIASEGKTTGLQTFGMITDNTKLFDAADTTHSGTVSAPQLAALAKPFDVNGDGWLSKIDIATMAKQYPATRTFNGHPVNGDQ